jgi:uncharacterized membrane protein
MMNDPALTAVSRRLLSIEGQLQQLRADVVETDAQRARKAARSSQARPEPEAEPQPSPQSAATPDPPPQATESARPIPDPLPTLIGSAQPRRASPGEPNALETLLSGRGLAVAGVLLMLVGCAFFIDLSFTRGWIAPAQRIALGLLVGSAVLAGSTRFLRGTYRVVAECAACLGAGVAFLASWASITVFPDLGVPRAAAFASMAIVACALTFIANRWRSQPIALMGLAGAYLTPILLGSVQADRAGLVAYLIIVTSGMLALARRRSFAAVEITAVVATVLYGAAFVPVPNFDWSNTSAASAATCFFIMFAAAFTTRPIRHGAPKIMALVPFIAATTIYVTLLENLLNGTPKILGCALLALATVLFAACTYIKQMPVELKPAYRGLALFAANLALRSLLQRFELFDAFSIEAAVLLIMGARIGNPNVTRIGLGLLAIAAVGLLWNAVTFAPTQALFTPLALGFAIWLQSAFSARRAIPQNIRQACAITVHAVAFAGITRTALDATGGPVWNLGVSLPSAAQLALSLSWALFAALLFGRGVTTRANVARWEGLTLFAITIIKVFCVDLASLDLTYRVLAFLGTGVLLFVSSVLYMRSLRVTQPHVPVVENIAV